MVIVVFSNLFHFYSCSFLFTLIAVSQSLRSPCNYGALVACPFRSSFRRRARKTRPRPTQSGSAKDAQLSRPGLNTIAYIYCDIPSSYLALYSHSILSLGNASKRRSKNCPQPSSFAQQRYRFKTGRQEIPRRESHPASSTHTVDHPRCIASLVYEVLLKPLCDINALHCGVRTHLACS